MPELILKAEVYQIVGAAMEVHSTLGCGFLEPVYQEALRYELQDRGIPFTEQAEVKIVYKNHALEKTYIPDFICYGKVVVEIKALEMLTTREEAQVLNYLKATGYEVGLLLNFGSDSLTWKRRVLTKPTKPISFREIREISG